MTSEELASSSKKVTLINYYATPLAVLLVTLGIILTQPASPVREISIGLLLFGIVFNIATARFIQNRAQASDPADWLVPVRLYGNLICNCLLIYYLGAFWSPMWLLLTLTPMATAIYGTRRQTLVSASTVAVVLLGIQALRPDNSLVDWGQRIVEVSYTFLISMLANALVTELRSRD